MGEGRMKLQGWASPRTTGTSMIVLLAVGGTIPILKYRDLSLGGTKRTNAEAVFSFRQVGWFEGVTPNSLC